MVPSPAPMGRLDACARVCVFEKRRLCARSRPALESEDLNFGFLFVRTLPHFQTLGSLGIDDCKNCLHRVRVREYVCSRV